MVAGGWSDWVNGTCTAACGGGGPWIATGCVIAQCHSTGVQSVMGMPLKVSYHAIQIHAQVTIEIEKTRHSAFNYKEHNCLWARKAEVATFSFPSSSRRLVCLDQWYLLHHLWCGCHDADKDVHRPRASVWGSKLLLCHKWGKQA